MLAYRWVFTGLVSAIVFSMAAIFHAYGKDNKLTQADPLRLPEPTVEFIKPVPTISYIERPTTVPVLKEERTKQITPFQIAVTLSAGAVAAFCISGFAFIIHERKRRHVLYASYFDHETCDIYPRSRQFTELMQRVGRTAERNGKKVLRPRADQSHVPEGELSRVLRRADRAGRDDHPASYGPHVPYDSAIGAWARVIRPEGKRPWRPGSRRTGSEE